MAFMQREITRLIPWLVIDGDRGLTSLPLDVVFPSQENAEALIEEMNEIGDFSDVADYYEGGQESIYSVELVHGHGCRLSAPGYMGCTDWTLFGTPEECEEYLDETCPENNE